MRGYVCFSIDYLLAEAPPADGGPLAGRAATFPQVIENTTANKRLFSLACVAHTDTAVLQNLYDCMRGVQFLRQHAAQLHVDPQRIGVIGKPNAHFRPRKDLDAVAN